MAIFAVVYRYSDDVDARDEHRAAHRAYLGERPTVMLTGPLAEPAGALLLVTAADLAEVETLLAGDPFLVEGVVVERTIRPYSPVGGSAVDGFVEAVATVGASTDGDASDAAGAGRGAGPR